MRKILFLLSGITFLSSCKKEDGPNLELIGDWKLIEILVDPGDGSGTFSSVESNKIITFHLNGTITSNGSLCDMSLEAINPTSGTYSTSDMTFNSNDCINPEYDFNFEQTGLTLILYYPCYEACIAKYLKQ